MIDMLRIPPHILVEMKDMIRQSRTPAPQISLSNLLGSKPLYGSSVVEYQHTIESKLQSLALEGITNVELVTHPARITEAFKLHDDYAWARELENNLVNSLAFAHFLKQRKFGLISHETLR